MARFPDHLLPHCEVIKEQLRRLFRSWEDDLAVQWQSHNGHLSIRVPSPLAQSEGDLELAFHTQEVDVFFQHWHSHLPLDATADCFAADLAELCRLVDGILADRLVVMHRYSGSDRVSSSLVSISPTTPPGTNMLTVGYPPGTVQVITRTETRSWSGAADQDHEHSRSERSSA